MSVEGLGRVSRLEKDDGGSVRSYYESDNV